MNIGRFPEVCDFVAVTVDYVEYYGYVDDVDFDLRHPSVVVEFFPGCRQRFDFSEITFVKFPEPQK
jgi:hypothetical protein